MIRKEEIEHIVLNQNLVEGLFVVDIQVSNKNEISVFIDSHVGINISQCTAISRLIENSLDRESEDFELRVSSPGLDQPLKVHEQYVKNIGRKVEVVKTDGKKHVGMLKEVTENAIEIEYAEKVTVEGKKKKQTIVRKPEINFEDIKSTKIVVTFN